MSLCSSYVLAARLEQVAARRERVTAAAATASSTATGPSAAGAAGAGAPRRQRLDRPESRYREPVRRRGVLHLAGAGPGAGGRGRGGGRRRDHRDAVRRRGLRFPRRRHAREVMDVLDGLRSGGRVVGLVGPRLADLRDRIPARLEVVENAGRFDAAPGQRLTRPLVMRGRPPGPWRRCGAPATRTAPARGSRDRAARATPTCPRGG